MSVSDLCACKASLDYTLFGTRALLLENEKIKTAILLDRGANIYEFVLKDKNHDFLFHHPRVKPRPPVLGTSFGIDNFWFGGIDEILPTAFPCVYKDEELGVIGELWAQSYSCELLDQSNDTVTAHLLTNTIISPYKVEKWVKMKAGEPKLTIRTRITNTAYRDYEFLWGYHATFAVTPNHRIDLPAGKMLVEDRPGSKFKPRSEYVWPFATDLSGRKHDLRKVLEPSALMYEYHYATEMKDGWLAVTDAKDQLGLGMSFPKETLSKLHLWLNYGIWRDCYNVGMYPLTGYPAALQQAVEKGACSRLGPGKSMECEVNFIAYSGLSEVSHIDPDGRVR